VVRGSWLWLKLRWIRIRIGIGIGIGLWIEIGSVCMICRYTWGWLGSSLVGHSNMGWDVDKPGAVCDCHVRFNGLGLWLLGVGGGGMDKVG